MSIRNDRTAVEQAIACGHELEAIADELQLPLTYVLDVRRAMDAAAGRDNAAERVKPDLTVCAVRESAAS